MAVVLTIEGAHMTDVLSQIHQMADATRAKQATIALDPASEKGDDEVLTKGSVDRSGALVNDEPEPEPQQAEEEPKKVKQWPVDRQKIAMEEMIEKGEIDEEAFPHLTKTRQKKVEERIKHKEAAQEEKRKDDEAVLKANSELSEGITRDHCRDLMNEMVRDEDGNPILSMMPKVRECIKSFTPEGMEERLASVPPEDIEELYYALKKLKEVGV